MSKGSSPAGQANTINPTQLMQQPFLQQGWEAAKGLFENNPIQYYPGQTLADYKAPNPLLAQGYQDVYRTGTGLNAMLPGYNQAYTGALTGGMAGANSPAYPYFQQFAGGTSAPQQTYQTLGAQAVGGNAGLEQLGKSASGAYLNANPYIDRMYAAAAAPVTERYQTAVAPGIAGQFSNAGRYGSGANAGAATSAYSNLGKTLGDLSTNIYGANYARERQAQDTAAGQFGQLTNQGLQLGLSAAQQDALARGIGASGLQSGFNTGNTAQLQALGMYPQYTAAQMAGPRATLEAGKGLTDIDQQYRAWQQASLDDASKRFYGTQEAPYSTLSKYLGNIGQPQTGSQAKDYFQNPIADALAGITGATSIGRNLLGTGGLFGGGADAAAAAGGVDFFSGMTAAELAAANAVSGTAAAEGGGFLASILPWIFSDRRLKEDDKVVGQVGDLPIHTFRYKGDEQRRIGFMADEVEKIDPHAVVKTDSGYKAVDYNRALGSALNSMMTRRKSE